MVITQYVATICLVILVLSILIATIRLWRGPTLADRVVALDFIAACGIGIIATYTIITQNPVLLDMGLVIALLSFLSTIAFSYLLQHSHFQDGNDNTPIVSPEEPPP